MLIKETNQMTESEKIAVRNSNNQYLKALAYAPVGMIIPFGGSNAPSTYLLCDGSSLDTTEYADLFSVIGYTYGGSGDIFNLPDLRGKTIVGLDTNDDDFNKLGKSGGNKVHTHTLNKAYAKIGQDIKGNTSTIAWKTSTYGYGIDSNMTTDVSIGVVSESNQIHPTGLGGNTDESNHIPPYIVTNFIIKAVNDIPEYNGSVEGGENGYSPTISVTEISTGHRVSITDINGTKTFNVLDGEDGYTPVKGTDYFTSEDKSAIVSEVINSLPIYNGEVESA